MQQYWIRVTNFVTQLCTQRWQIFNADQVSRDDSTLVYNTCIVFQCYMLQLYSTLKNFPVCHKLNFRVSVHQSTVWKCVVNVCQTYVLQLYRILSQQLQPCMCCPAIILTSITVYTPYTDHKYCSAHAYVISQLLNAATGTSSKVLLFVIVPARRAGTMLVIQKIGIRSNRNLIGFAAPTILV